MRHTLAAYPPDLLIEVPRTTCRSLEFHRAAEVIEIGQELAATALDTRRSPAAVADESDAEEPRHSRPPRAGPARDRRAPTGSGTPDRAGCGPNAASDASSAKTASVSPGKAAISATAPSPNGDGDELADGTSTTTASQSAAADHVDGAADTAVHEAAVADRHRRPRPGHRAAGGDRIDQRDARVAVEDHQFARRDVDRRHPKHPLGPVVRRAVGGRSRRGAPARRRCRWPARSRRCVAASAPWWRRASPSPSTNSSVMSSMSTPESSSWRRRPRPGAANSSSSVAAAAELRGHRRPGRGAEQHVGAEQRASHVGRLVGDAVQDARSPRRCPPIPPPASTSPRFVTGTECARRSGRQGLDLRRSSRHGCACLTAANHAVASERV